MKDYLKLLEKVLKKGKDGPDRTGVGMRSYVAEDTSLEFKMEDGFPAITTKKLLFRSVKAELLWFLQGTRDIKPLQERGCHIWDDNVEAWDGKEFETDAGRIYGVQWRGWKTPDGREIDQIDNAIKNAKEVYYSRENVVSAYNVGELDQMSLPPCHDIFQLRIIEGNMDLIMFQRSADMFLGVPFNIASYSLLLHMLAQITGYAPRKVVLHFGIPHIYLNHIDQVEKQLSRPSYPRPKLELNPAIKDIDNFTMDDIELTNYRHHPYIQAPMAV